MQHTSSPWKVFDYDDALHVDGIGRKTICCIASRYYDTNEERANAHLIAAAPELVQACKVGTTHHPKSHKEEPSKMKDVILKQDAPLYIDVICYDCKRLVALSNTNEFDGRRYCNRCLPYDNHNFAISTMVSRRIKWKTNTY
jgi:hypothetical protein